MKSFTLISTLLSSVSFLPVTATEECHYSIELLALQDASDSFYDHVDRWSQTAHTLVERLQEEFGEFKIGLSSFTDKPVPVSGYGNYGGWASSTQDYCYESNVPLSSDVASLTQGLKALTGKIGSGFDYLEGQIEAMLFALLDKQVGWSPANVTHSESGRPIARILMLLTDAKAHEPGHAAQNIARWNAPRQYPNGYNQRSVGGFGSHDFLLPTACPYCISDALSSVEYPELADLYAIKDAAAAGVGPGLTEAQQARMEDLLDLMGPETWPAPIAPHPGDDSTDCTLTEYPGMEQVVDLFLRKGVLPIFMANTKESQEYFEWYDDNMYKPSGLNAVIARFDSNSLFEDMVNAISKLVEKQCIAPQTEPPTEKPTSAAATTEAGLIVVPPVDVPTAEAVSTTTEVVPTTEGVPTAGVVPTTEGVPATQAPQGTTNVAASEPSEDGATSAAAGQPPFVAGGAEGGNSTGTIAGATAGAAAGLAAVGGLLYKTVGASWFGTGTPEMVNMDQVETPDTPVEREAMEEVTMDMFN